ncbi:Shikimate kinase I [Staphylococcus aureus]|uniref:Shikimate kinase I n=1 Tax=Staphylococcus aureus TaxID=1280 RepID=A0A380EI74_STAAU|nr:Shikimate kinase I [Staphylococcus aureus]
MSKNLSFIDIDSYIEEKYKLTIPEIFCKHGEQYFRNLEFTCLQECINTADIIATGGGIIESEEAFNFLKNQKNIIWLDCILILYIVESMMTHIDLMQIIRQSSS